MYYYTSNIYMLFICIHSTLHYLCTTEISCTICKFMLVKVTCKRSLIVIRSPLHTTSVRKMFFYFIFYVILCWYSYVSCKMLYFLYVCNKEFYLSIYLSYLLFIENVGEI